MSKVTLSLFLMNFQNQGVGFFFHFLVFLAVENVLSFTVTRFHRKWERTTIWKRFTLISATIWHKSFWQDIYIMENRNLWPHTTPSKPNNSKTWDCPTHVLIFFLISSTFSISCTIAHTVVWMLQKSYNIIIIEYNAQDIRKGLLPNNCKRLLPNSNTSHSCQNLF